MPIYAYKCSACGHADDVLQKVSADALTVCPACNQATYSKQVTAPQFQLKGSGWYVTDFRGGNAPAKDGAAKADAKPAAGSDTKTETKTETATACPVHSTPAPAPAAAPAPKPATTE